MCVCVCVCVCVLLFTPLSYNRHAWQRIWCFILYTAQLLLILHSMDKNLPNIWKHYCTEHDSYKWIQLMVYPLCYSWKSIQWTESTVLFEAYWRPSITLWPKLKKKMQRNNTPVKPYWNCMAGWQWYVDKNAVSGHVFLLALQAKLYASEFAQVFDWGISQLYHSRCKTISY